MAKSPLTRLCATHVNRKRNHGHPEQRPIRSHDLRPYLRRIRTWRKAVHLQLWPAIDQQWSDVLVPLAQDNLQARGESAKYRRLAAHELLAIDAGVADKARIADLNLAIWLFYQENRSRFVNADCFVHTLGKLTRRLCPSSRRRTFSVQAGEFHTWSKYASPRTIRQLGEWLIEAYGTAGVTLAKTQFERKRTAKRQKERLKELLGAISAISELNDQAPEGEGSAFA
jgi:hypothetical protein